MDEFADGGVIPFDPDRPLVVEPRDLCTYIVPWSTVQRLGIGLDFMRKEAV